MSKPVMLIRRILLLRLLGAALLLSVVLGAVAFVIEWRQLGERVKDMAQMGVEVLRIQMPHLLPREIGASQEPPLQQLADDFIRHPPRSDSGHFVVIIFYDASMQEKVRSIDRAYPDGQRLVEALTSIGADTKDSHVILGATLSGSYGRGIPFLLTISGERGETLGYMKGIFAPSPAVEAELFRTALWASALAVAFVLMTALVIYPVISSLVARQEKQAVQLFLANVDMMKVLGSAIAKRDSDTDAHNFRVAIYSLHLAEAARLNPKDIHGLLKGAFLHDIGKIGIPDAILHKPGSLSEVEKTVMQSHVQYGLDIVGNAVWLADAANIVGCHHEQFDGSGYPNGIAGDAIPLTARIFAIVDVFDALTSERPYKKAYGIERSLEILRQCAGRHFDPELIEIFEPIAPALFESVAVPHEELLRLLEVVAMPYSGFDRKIMNP